MTTTPPAGPATTTQRASTAAAAGQLTVQVIGGPTAVIELGGLRFLTDPTFDGPGDHPVGQRTLVKTEGPALTPAEIGPVDAVLLSHDQHPDNLDSSGRAVLADVPLALTTSVAAERLGGTARALPPWQRLDLTCPSGQPLHVTGVPAQHGPDGSEHVTGPVTGFVLTGADLPTVYVSGDNASLDVVRAVAARCGPVDVALLFAGAARTPLLDGELTLGSVEAVQAARILGARAVVPLHTEGWEHFQQGPDSIVDAFAAAGEEDRLVLLTPGQSATF